MTYCGNQCKLPLLNYVTAQNNWNRYIGKKLNNIDIFSYSPLKIDKSFEFNYEELSDPKKTTFNNAWLQ